MPVEACGAIRSPVSGCSPDSFDWLGHCQALPQPDYAAQGLDNLAQIVGQAPQQPLAIHLRQPAQQEPPQAPPLLHLPEDWLDGLLALGVGRPTLIGREPGARQLP